MVIEQKDIKFKKNDHNIRSLRFASSPSALTEYVKEVFSEKEFLAKMRSRRFSSWISRIAFLLIIAAIVCGFATYLALNALPPFGDDPNTVFWLLNLDLIILLLLVTLIARRVVSLLSRRRKGLAGSRLHVRLVFIFSILAATPAIIMTIFSAFFLHYGVQSWFSERVSTAVNESQAVAQAYLAEHHQVIKVDTLAMANDLNRQASLLLGNQVAFDRIMQTQSVIRNLSEAVVFDSRGHIFSKSGLTFSLDFELVPEFALNSAQEGDVALMTGSADDRIRALVKLNNFSDAYLYVGRMVDPTVLRHVNDTRQAVKEYERLQGHSFDLQLKVTLIFVVVALLLLFAAIWFGLNFSKQLVIPISDLINAADRVRDGDLNARVPNYERGDEFDVLGRTFNRMTSQLQQQRDELIMANRQLDQRRRFTEAVLAGVSSGIIGVDDKGIITLVNTSAAQLFHLKSKTMVGLDIGEILPELSVLLKQAHERPKKITQTELPFITNQDTKRIFLVRIAIEVLGEQDNGAVLTFDDITELQLAQRKAAWADVARRIAHEIKNPLTPIQLSAERLKRKYLIQIKDDPETFSKCTDTIIRHVSDIGRMVNEFSNFARMPVATLKYDNIVNHIQDTLFLQQQAHPDIDFHITGGGYKLEPIYTEFDAQQIRQAFTNILQNALDSINSRIVNERLELGNEIEKGKINILIENVIDRQEVVIAVIDNGLGLPKNEDPLRLTEPYVTHRDKGTGLGLAIVKKIMDDHHGSLLLGSTEWINSMDGGQSLGGATIVLTIPLIINENDNIAEVKQRKLLA